MKSLSLTTAAAAFAAVGNAFLIPSTVSMPEVTIENLDPIAASAALVNNFHVELDCKHCPTPSGFVERLKSLSLILPFAISDDRKSITLNGRPLYPIPNDKFTALQAVFVENPAEYTDELIPPSIQIDRPITWSMIDSELLAEDANEPNLLTLNFTVTGIEDTLLDLEGVNIRLLKDAQDDTLTLVDIVKVKAEDATRFTEIPSIGGLATPPFNPRPQASCGTGISSLFCRIGTFLTGTAPGHGRRRGGCRGRGRHNFTMIKDGEVIARPPSGRPPHPFFTRPASSDRPPFNGHPTFSGRPDFAGRPPFAGHGRPPFAHPGVPTRGGPPKFWRPNDDGKVDVDAKDGADFHIMPFGHPAVDGQQAGHAKGPGFNQLTVLAVITAGALTAIGVAYSTLR